jgi:hypothetical protein
MKPLFFISILISFVGCTSSPSSEILPVSAAPIKTEPSSVTKTETPALVFICDSKSAARYHLKENCRGLQKCNYRIIQVTLNDAQQKNRTMCRMEQ